MNKQNNRVNERWSNVALKYNQYRLSPPEALIQWLSEMACGTKKPQVVVDIGCGTGLSTKPWVPFARQVIGIDPSEELLTVARSQNHHDQISYLKGIGSDSGLKENSADIVTAMHSIHWMEPYTTITEIKRVLKIRGTFVIYAHNWPPTSLFPELDHEYFKLRNRINKLIKQHAFNEGMHLFMPEFGQLMVKSNHFEYFREFYYSNELDWTANDYIDWIYTFGNIQKLMTIAGYTEEETGLTHFKEIVNRIFALRKNRVLVTWRIFLFQNPDK